MRYEVDHPLIAHMENQRAKEQRELEAIRRREEAERRRLLSQPKPDSFEYKYQQIEREVTEAIEGGAKDPIKAVQDILRQFSPKTKVEDFNSRKNKDKSAEALITLDYEEKSRRGGTEVRKKPSTVYLKHIDKNNPDREGFIESALHESIHMLQEESSDRESVESFFNRYFANVRDKKFCQMTRGVLFDTFKDVEGEIHSICKKLYSGNGRVKSIELAPDDYDTINFLLDCRDEHALYRKVSAKIDKAMQENPEIVKKFGKNIIYEFICLSARSEIEAYEKSDYSVRKITNTGIRPYQITLMTLYKAVESICETRMKYEGKLFRNY